MLELKFDLYAFAKADKILLHAFDKTTSSKHVQDGINTMS